MGHARRIGVFKDVNYGASKTSSTAEVALNPADLADGALGIYGIHTAGSTNLNKLVLITDGGSEAAGKVPVASFVGTEYDIHVGTANGNLLLGRIATAQVGQGLKETTAKVYTAPVKGITAVGYNGTTGALSMPVLVKGDEISIGVSDLNTKVAGFTNVMANQERYSATLLSTDTKYSSLVKLLNKINSIDLAQRSIVTGRILHNATGAVFTTAATVAAVNGATTLTTSAAHGVAVGDWVSLAGDVYQAITGTTGSTLVLDRPYNGPTAIIPNASAIDLTAAPTEVGIEIVDKNFFQNVVVTTQGVIELATITRTVLPLIGSGSFDHVRNLEKEFRSMLGTSDEITSYIPKEPFKADPAITYDMYVMRVQNPSDARGDQGAVFRVFKYTYLFFPSTVADTAGKNQSDYEDIMAVLFGATFPTLF